MQNITSSKRLSRQHKHCSKNIFSNTEGKKRNPNPDTNQEPVCRELHLLVKQSLPYLKHKVDFSVAQGCFRPTLSTLRAYGPSAQCKEKNKVLLGHNRLLREPSKDCIIWILNQIMQRKVTGKLVTHLTHKKVSDKLNLREMCKRQLW